MPTPKYIIICHLLNLTGIFCFVEVHPPSQLTTPSLTELSGHFSELPVEVLKPLSNLEIIEKQTAVFECEISKANETAKWFQAGTEIVDWERFTPEVEGKVHRLTITNGELEDTHKYSCYFRHDKKTSGKLLVKGAVNLHAVSTFYGLFFISFLVMKSFMFALSLKIDIYCSIFFSPNIA